MKFGKTLLVLVLAMLFVFVAMTASAQVDTKAEAVLKQVVYANKVTEIMSPWIMAMKGVGEQSTLAGASPMLMLDADWRRLTVVYLAVLGTPEGWLKELTPPAHLKPVHRELLKAAKLSTQAAALYAKGVDTMDGSKIIAASRKMAEVGKVMGKATALLEKLRIK